MVSVRQPAHQRRIGETVMSEKHILDARRLLCPMPVIRLQEFVSKVQCGDLIEVRCTDPGARSDIPAWCRINGHQLVGIEDGREELVITIRVSGAQGRLA